MELAVRITKAYMSSADEISTKTVEIPVLVAVRRGSINGTGI